MQTVRELLTCTFPPEPYLIDEGIMRLNSIMVIGGAPKAYKSFLQNSLILALVTGTPLFGAHRKSHGREERAFVTSRPCRVLMLEQELGNYDLRERLIPMIRSLPHDQAKLFGENLYTHSMDHTLQLDTEDGMKRIDALVAEARPDVLVLDPLIEFHTSDENSTQAMACVLRNLDLLRQKYNLCLSISHHTGKPNDNSSRSGPDLLRGNSVIYGKGDAFFMASVRNRAAGIVKIEPVIRRGKPIAPFYVAIDWADLRAKFHCWHTKETAKQMNKLVVEDSDEPLQ